MKVVFVSASDLRARFNEARLYERVLAGEIDAIVMRCTTPGRRSGQEPGTLSESVHYWYEGTEIAQVHQFRRPDDSLGASGVPDPKWMLVDGVKYMLGSLE